MDKGEIRVKEKISNIYRETEGNRPKFIVLLNIKGENFKTGDIVELELVVLPRFHPNETNIYHEERTIRGKLYIPPSTNIDSNEIEVDVSKEFDSHIEHICIDDIISIRKIK